MFRVIITSQYDINHFLFKCLILFCCMSSFLIRPRFKYLIVSEKNELELKIRNRLQTKKQFTVSYLPGHIYLKINRSKQHFWSPQLHLSFEQKGPNVVIRGLYGPNPTLWAVFFFGYLALSILAIFIGMWGLSRMALEMDASVLWVIPGLAVCALILYFIGQTGQKIGAQQMFDLHHFYESTTGDKIDVS